MSEFTEHTFTTEDGIELEYRDYVATGEGRSVPVICLHGLTRNMRDFEEVAPKIASLGFRTITPSQRGRGGSGCDYDPSRYNPDQYTSDMIALLDELDIPNAVFVGSSMGGIITMLLSEREPSRVRAAILNDIGTELDPVGVTRIMGYVGEAHTFDSWEEAAAHCRNGNGFAFPNETSDEYWMAFAKRVCRKTVLNRITYAYDLAIAIPTQSAHAQVPDYTNSFSTLRQKPVLLVRGQTSDLLAPTTVEKMKSIHPKLQFIEVENVGHVPFMSELDAWPHVASFLDAIE